MSQPSPRRSPRRQPGPPSSSESVGAEAQGERSAKDAQSLANWRQTFGVMQRQAAKENQKKQAAEKAAAQAKAKEAQKVSDKGKKKAAEKELEEEGEEEEKEEACQVERAPGAKIAQNRVTKPIAQKKKQKSEHDVKWGTLITYPARLKDVECGDCLRVDRAAHEIYCKACNKTIGGRMASITAHLGVSASKTNTGQRHKDNYKRWKTSQSIFVLNEAYVKVRIYHALGVRVGDACVCVVHVRDMCVRVRVSLSAICTVLRCIRMYHAHLMHRITICLGKERWIRKS